MPTLSHTLSHTGHRAESFYRPRGAFAWNEADGTRQMRCSVSGREEVGKLKGGLQRIK